MKKQFLLVLCVLATYGAFAQSKPPFVETVGKPNAWVDSVYRKLNKNERIAQLLMVRAHTDRGKRFEDSIARVIAKEKIGGLVFFQGGPARQAALTNRYQAISKVPLLIALDGEWGVGMRLDSTISFPYQMTLGAVQNNDLIYKMGREVATDFKRLGMHVNFAPDADINNNPKNPVIGFRSFGENKYNVTAKTGAYMKGMQDNGLLISLKHFPGHGDTDVDSHYDLPQLRFTRERLDSLEMYPFRELIKQNASGVMVAHMNIPVLDNTPNLPSTLSKPIVTGVLKEQLGFKGLVYSDAMGMVGVVKHFKNGEADVRAIIAGNDIIELSENSVRAVKLVRKAIRQKRLSWERIEESAKKVLTAKYWAGLNNYQPVSMVNVAADMQRPAALTLNQQLSDASVTMLKSDAFLSGMSRDKNTALVIIGPSQITTFNKEVSPLFHNQKTYILPKDATANDIAAVARELRNYEQVVLSVYDTRTRPQPVLDIKTDLKLLIADIAKMNSLVAVFANAYSIAGLPGIEQARTILMNYENSENMQRASAKVLNGQLKPSGKLPVTINTYFKYGDGK